MWGHLLHEKLLKDKNTVRFESNKVKKTKPKYIDIYIYGWKLKIKKKVNGKFCYVINRCWMFFVVLLKIESMLYIYFVQICVWNHTHRQLSCKLVACIKPSIYLYFALIFHSKTFLILPCNYKAIVVKVYVSVP